MRPGGRLATLGTGPVRLQGRLARAGRPLRREPGGGAVERVQARLPSELHGGALLDVLSERLRALLAAPAAGGGPAHPAVPRPGGEPLAPPAGDPWRANGTAPAVATARAAGGAQALDAGRRPGPATAAAGAAARTPPADDPAAAQALPKTAAEGVLAERVRRYWDTVARGRVVAAARVHRGAALDQAPGALAEPFAGPGGLLRPAPLPDAEVARALGAFAAGVPFPPAARAEPSAVADAVTRPGPAGAPLPGAPGGDGRPPHAHPGDTVPGPAAWLRPGVAGGVPSRAAALRDLADDMAEVLRQQAIHHGIDVP